MTLRQRLVLFITVMVAAALLVQGILGYLNFQRLLYADLDHDLNDYLAQLVREVQALPGRPRGETLSFQDLDARFDDYLTSARIVHQGRVKETFGTFPVGVPLSAPLTIGSAQGPAQAPAQSFGVWRVMSRRLSPDLFLQGAIASPAPAYSLGRYRETVLVTTLLVSALGALAALLVSGPVLRPLRQLLVTVRRVADSGDLSLRVPGGGQGELADLSETFNRMMTRLSGFLERETQFTRNASHELRTPLTAMRLQLSAYRENYADADETLAVLSEEVERMISLSASLLTLARENRSQVVTFDLAALVKDAAREHSAHYQGPDALNFTGDPILLQQALLNLLDNARKHAPGAPVVVGLEPPTQGILSLSVSDHGPGMSPEALAKAVHPFYRTPGTSAPGSGLGLSVAAQVAAVHGGELILAANSPTGLTVKLRLPVSAQVASSSSAPTVPTVPTVPTESANA